MFSYRKGKHLPTAFQVWGIIAQKLDPAQFSTAKDIWKGVKPVLCKRGRLVFDKVFDKKYVKYRISYLVAVQKKKEAKCYLDNSRKKNGYQFHPQWYLPLWFWNTHQRSDQPLVHQTKQLFTIEKNIATSPRLACASYSSHRLLQCLSQTFVAHG